ncbi:hypothetical protein BV25DRAFT_1840037 [Artomyces pyxidatus]|uniref:Uncharacterized protein n=1 Tax=Artomyces pyxidatus TaxID=48021 RepID=A0ACB8SVE7_9AGAM|nr:hypothetical protein BV25DRAFT_1840037 [Artomyces pyxidatus]
MPLIMTPDGKDFLCNRWPNGIARISTPAPSVHDPWHKIPTTLEQLKEWCCYNHNVGRTYNFNRQFLCVHKTTSPPPSFRGVGNHSPVNIRFEGFVHSQNLAQFGDWDGEEETAATAEHHITLDAGDFPDLFQHQIDTIHSFVLLAEQSLGFLSKPSGRTTSRGFEERRIFFKRRVFFKRTGDSPARVFINLSGTLAHSAALIRRTWLPARSVRVSQRVPMKRRIVLDPRELHVGDFVQVTARAMIFIARDENGVPFPEVHLEPFEVHLLCPKADVPVCYTITCLERNLRSESNRQDSVGNFKTQLFKGDGDLIEPFVRDTMGEASGLCIDGIGRTSRPRKEQDSDIWIDEDLDPGVNFLFSLRNYRWSFFSSTEGTSLVILLRGSRWLLPVLDSDIWIDEDLDPGVSPRKEQDSDIWIDEDLDPGVNFLFSLRNYRWSFFSSTEGTRKSKPATRLVTPPDSSLTHPMGSKVDFVILLRWLLPVLRSHIFQFLSRHSFTSSPSTGCPSTSRKEHAKFKVHAATDIVEYSQVNLLSQLHNRAIFTPSGLSSPNPSSTAWQRAASVLLRLCAIEEYCTLVSHRQLDDVVSAVVMYIHFIALAPDVVDLFHHAESEIMLDVDALHRVARDTVDSSYWRGEEPLVYISRRIRQQIQVRVPGPERVYHAIDVAVAPDGVPMEYLPPMPVRDLRLRKGSVCVVLPSAIPVGLFSKTPVVIQEFRDDAIIVKTLPDRNDFLIERRDYLYSVKGSKIPPFKRSQFPLELLGEQVDWKDARSPAFALLSDVVPSSAVQTEHTANAKPPSSN